MGVRDNFLCVVVGCAACLWGVCAIAEELPAENKASGRQELTWQSCMVSACEHNPDILAAQFNVKKTSSSAKAVAGQRYPTVALESSLAKAEDGASDDGQAGLSSSSSQMQEDETSISLVSRYDLYTGGRITSEIRGANAARRQAGATLDSTRHEILCDLRRAFTSLLYAQEQIALSESIAKQRETNLGLVQLRFEGGIEHKGSYLLSRALHEQALMEIRQSQRMRRTAQLELARLMGRPAESENLTAKGSLDAAWQVSSTNWEERVRNHPLSKAKEAELDIAIEGVEQARSKSRPTLALVGSSSVYSKEIDLDTYRWKVALVLSLPVFTGWQNENVLAASKEGVRMAGETLRSTQGKLRTQMETSLAQLIDARERVEVQRTLLSAVTIRAEIARQQFNSGLLRFENWDLIENDSISKQKEMLIVLRDAMVADTDLRRALGSGELP